MANESHLLTRRSVVGLMSAAALAVVVLPRPALAALDTAGAQALIGSVVGDINATINSGASRGAMYRDFEGIFARYGDVPVIARTALGPAARSASAAQMRAFTDAFSGYLARKYGSRFREFIGGRVEVQKAARVKTFYEVTTTAILRGQPPFEVKFQVSDRSGRNLFFNIIIEGVNMLAAERTEIGALLDQRRGNLDQLIADLQRI